MIRGSMVGAPNSVTGGALLRFAQLGFSAILRKEFPDIPPHDLITGRAQANQRKRKEHLDYTGRVNVRFPDFMTTFYHVQVGALETQEFRTTPVPFWLVCFSDTVKGPLRQMFFVALLPDGTVVEPRVVKRV